MHTVSRTLKKNNISRQKSIKTHKHKKNNVLVSDRHLKKQIKKF